MGFATMFSGKNRGLMIFIMGSVLLVSSVLGMKGRRRLIGMANQYTVTGMPAEYGRLNGTYVKLTPLIYTRQVTDNHFGMSISKKMRVVKVSGAAQDQGIQKGMVLTHVNGVSVNDDNWHKEYKRNLTQIPFNLTLRQTCYRNERGCHLSCTGAKWRLVMTGTENFMILKRIPGIEEGKVKVRTLRDKGGKKYAVYMQGK